MNSGTNYNVDYNTMATDLLNAGMGDVGRLQFIKECIQNKKLLYNTDQKYLNQKYQEFEDKLDILSGGKKKKPKTILSENDLDKIVDEALAKENKSQNTIITSSKSKENSSIFKRLFSKK